MSAFEDRLRRAAESGRAAGEEEATSGKYTNGELDALTPEDAGFSETEILVKVTGEKSLGDQEQADIIIGVFEDSFFDAIQEHIENGD